MKKPEITVELGEVIIESLDIMGEPNEQLVRIHGDMRTKYAEVGATSSGAEGVMIQLGAREHTRGIDTEKKGKLTNITINIEGGYWMAHAEIGRYTLDIILVRSLSKFEREQCEEVWVNPDDYYAKDGALGGLVAATKAALDAEFLQHCAATAEMLAASSSTAKWDQARGGASPGGPGDVSFIPDPMKAKYVETENYHRQADAAARMMTARAHALSQIPGVIVMGDEFILPAPAKHVVLGVEQTDWTKHQGWPYVNGPADTDPKVCLHEDAIRKCYPWCGWCHTKLEG